MRTAFVGPEETRWQDLIACVPHDLFHLPGYVRACANHEGGEPLAFVAEEEGQMFFLPLVVRPVHVEGTPTEYFDATSPYGYPSPLLQPPLQTQDSSGFLERALEAMFEELRQRRIISLFVRDHPVLQTPLVKMASHGRVVEHGETVVIDLSLPEEELWRETRMTHRTGISKANRAGYRACIDESWQYFDEFLDIYAETMQRVGASEYYLFPPSYFLTLKEALGEHLHLCAVLCDDTVACAGLFSEVDGIVQFYLSGMRMQHTKRHPSKAMLHFMRGWAKSRGNRWFHLGGGLGARKDSLFEFKAGFSKGRAPFYTWRGIIDQSAYNRVVAQWETIAGVAADPEDLYFPIYRKSAAAHPTAPVVNVLPPATRPDS